MGWFNDTIKAAVRHEIQAMEGEYSDHDMDSLRLDTEKKSSIDGVVNRYKTWMGQVVETYRKYNGLSEFGCAQTRAVVDLRTALIAGEGVTISCTDDALAQWIEKLLTDNSMLIGGALLRGVKSCEMVGSALYKLSVISGSDDRETENADPEIVIQRCVWRPQLYYAPVYGPGDEMLERGEPVRIDKIQCDKNQKKESRPFLNENFIYIATGGDDIASSGTTTKVGVVLTDIENYDRAIKDMRRNNHITARVTPVFETADEKAANILGKKLADTRWSIGKAFAGSAKFRYETPKSGAHENLMSELTSTVKNIAAVTGVPVHWLGFVDLMSNRSTSDSLYEMVKHATLAERSVWEQRMYDLVYKAQELYINRGGNQIRLNADFQIRLPLIDYELFEKRVKALSLAYNDDAISLDDYRNGIPGIDPQKTARAVEEENTVFSPPMETPDPMAMGSMNGQG